MPNINELKSQAVGRLSHGDGARLIAQLSEKAANLAMERPGLTKEAAFTQLLDQNPQAYAAYKADHDAVCAMATSGLLTPAEALRLK
jgi:hypothetical protein